MDNPVAVTNIGIEGVVYCGVPDWVYEGDSIFFDHFTKVKNIKIVTAPLYKHFVHKRTKIYLRREHV